MSSYIHQYGGGAPKDEKGAYLNIEQTLVLIKPEAIVQDQGLVGEVTKRFEAKGFRLLAVRMVQPTIDVVSMHCSDIMNESVRNRVIQYMMSGPIIAMVLEAPDAIRAGRLMINPTKILQPDDKLKKQPPAAGSIRGTYSRSALLNVIHGSDSREAAAREIALWFPDRQLSVPSWTPNMTAPDPRTNSTGYPASSRPTNDGRFYTYSYNGPYFQQ